MNTTELSSWKTIEAGILARAAKDPVFRQHLIENPRATIFEELERQGLKSNTIPSGWSFKIVEADENEVVLILPKVSESSRELSSEDLDHVSAGWVSISPGYMPE